MNPKWPRLLPNGNGHPLGDGRYLARFARVLSAEHPFEVQHDDMYSVEPYAHGTTPPFPDVLGYFGKMAFSYIAREKSSVISEATPRHLSLRPTD